MMHRGTSQAVVILLATTLVLGVLCLMGLGYSCASYNQIIALDERVDSRWSQVENVLQRRADLVPNLVETVRATAAQEREIFTRVAEARTKYFNAQGRSEKMQAAAGLERALSRLLVLQERYPELRSQESFQRLMDELAGTENRIAVERKRYNEAVEHLNSYIRRFPGRMFVGLTDVEAAAYFEAEAGAEEPPDVRFDIGDGGAAPPSTAPAGT